MILLYNRLEGGAERHGNAAKRTLEDEKALKYSRARTQRHRSESHSARFIWYLQQLEETALLKGN